MAVTISRAEYESLLKDSHEYRLICDALYQAGISPLSLGVFDNEDYWNSFQPPPTQNWRDHAEIPAVPSDVKRSASSEYKGSRPKFFYNSSAVANGHRKAWELNWRQTLPDTPTNLEQDSSFGDVIDDDDDGFSVFTTTALRKEQRQGHTLLFSRLPEGITHREITHVVRGGRLVEIHIRAVERLAEVTFVDEAAAAAFMSYAKRNDIYIRTKRVEVSLSPHQYRISPKFARNLADGVSRNLVIRGGASKCLTEKFIRDDLEHIHNLHVTDIITKGPDIYISTNSVRGCMFARTCMMSRLLYKGLSIQWYADECNGPLPVLPKLKLASMPAVKSLAPTNNSLLKNRFNLLRMDDSQSGSEDSSPLDNDNESRTSGIRLDPRSATSSTTD